MYLVGSRVECLYEIRPGKLCRAHRAAADPTCHVCGNRSRTRPVDSKDDWDPGTVVTTWRCDEFAVRAFLAELTPRGAVS